MEASACELSAITNGKGCCRNRPRLAIACFPDTAVRRLRFIKHAQGLGFSLAEIRELLSVRENADAGAQDMRERARAKKQVRRSKSLIHK